VGRFLKLNRFHLHLSNRSARYALHFLCVKYAPIHVYFSVMDWLFPERVGKKYKANYAYPIGGEYVVDVDSHNVWVPHNHDECHPICMECLYISKDLALHICEAIEENYKDIQIVFSDRRGFHIHVLDFNLRDWTYYNDHHPIKSHEVARFKYTRHLAFNRYGFNRPHFIVSTDPMRLIAVPNSLNGVSGLRCLPIGGRRDLERLSIESLVEKAGYYAHPELIDCANMPTLADA
jgi:DNA primase catalytic subunit